MNIKFLKIAFLRIVYNLFETKKSLISGILVNGINIKGLNTIGNPYINGSLILNNESIIAKR